MTEPKLELADLFRSLDDGDLGVMSEPIQQRGDAGGVGEDLVPVSKCSV
jgi:hypothetical protein